MEYYKCNRCGETFSADEVWIRQSHVTGYNVPDGGYYEDECLCPHCKSDDYYEVYKCEDCEELFDELYEGRCEECLKDWAFHEIDEVWDYLKKDLDDFAEFVKTVEQERAKERMKK